MEIADLPALNASLNALATSLLVAGYISIRRGHRLVHKRFMLAALAASAAFLTSYVIYHANAGSRPFPGEGTIRIIYFAILMTHVPLAALILPLALITVYRGLNNQLNAHVRVARWTLPVWLYVSVTGVLIYVMLYRMY